MAKKKMGMGMKKGKVKTQTLDILPMGIGGFMNPTVTMVGGGVGQVPTGMRHMGKKKTLVAGGKGNMHMGMRRGLTKGKGNMHMGNMGSMRKGLDAVNSWLLIKKGNGTCECLQKARGQLVIGRYATLKECEDNRSHSC